MAKRFADLGVDRLVSLPPPKGKELFSLNSSVTEITDYIQQVGDTVVSKV
jgi:hypothetical protein